MTAQVGMIPKKGLGVVILTNASYSNLPPLIAYKVYDALLDRDGRDWDAHFEELERQTEQWFANFKPAEADQGTHMSLDEPAYAGNYHDDCYGPAVIDYKDGQLTVELPDLGYTGTLSHRHYDTFNVDWQVEKHSIIRAYLPQIQFILDRNGKAESLATGLAKFRRLEK